MNRRGLEVAMKGMNVLAGSSASLVDRLISAWTNEFWSLNDHEIPTQELIDEWREIRVSFVPQPVGVIISAEVALRTRSQSDLQSLAARIACFCLAIAEEIGRQSEARQKSI